MIRIERLGAVSSGVGSGLDDFALEVRDRLLPSALALRRSPSDSDVLEAMESRDTLLLDLREVPVRRLLSACRLPLPAVVEPVDLDGRLDTDRRSFLTGARKE